MTLKQCEQKNYNEFSFKNKESYKKRKQQDIKSDDLLEQETDDSFIFSIEDLESYIKSKFAQSKDENLEIDFSVIVDLEENLIESIMDSSSISKESFDKLKNILLIPIFRVGAKNIRELIIDSTFKTNSEKFELFAIMLNCEGFGIPLAYFLLNTQYNSVATINDDVITRSAALREFFK
ncbi:14723_t:CDS:2, partial [Racocetra fulgida]